MTQATKILDITRSYIPVNPLEYPNNYHSTQKEDAPEDAPPIVAYEGHNFLPTSYGYKSYFGCASALGVEALTSKVDKLLLFQTADYRNILIALCDDGIWTKAGEEAGAWTHSIPLTASTEELHFDWTYTLLENDLYVYRVGSEVYWKMAFTVSAEMVDALPYAGPISVSVALVPSTNQTGTFSYAVAYKNVDGWVSAPTPFVEITVADESVGASWPYAAGATGYRLYKKVGTEIRYWDILNTFGTATFEFADSTLWSEGTVVTLPDSTWLSSASLDSAIFIEQTPTFLTMEGQMGIFSAGPRLGFWDTKIGRASGRERV